MTADTSSPEADKPEAKGVEVDKHGDPLLLGTRMLERESYERVTEGLKMAADGCRHLAFHFKGDDQIVNGTKWDNLAVGLDMVRSAAVDVAGIEDKLRFKNSEEVRRNPMSYRSAYKRVLSGLTQAAGGMRQLATCFRIDMRWSAMAATVENMERKCRTPKRSRLILQ